MLWEGDGLYRVDGCICLWGTLYCTLADGLLMQPFQCIEDHCMVPVEDAVHLTCIKQRTVSTLGYPNVSELNMPRSLVESSAITSPLPSHSRLQMDLMIHQIIHQLHHFFTWMVKSFDQQGNSIPLRLFLLHHTSHQTKNANPFPFHAIAYISWLAQNMTSSIYMLLSHKA